VSRRASQHHAAPQAACRARQNRVGCAARCPPAQFAGRHRALRRPCTWRGAPSRRASPESHRSVRSSFAPASVLVSAVGAGAHWPVALRRASTMRCPGKSATGPRACRRKKPPPCLASGRISRRVASRNFSRAALSRLRRGAPAPSRFAPPNQVWPRTGIGFRPRRRKNQGRGGAWSLCGLKASSNSAGRRKRLQAEPNPNPNPPHPAPGWAGRGVRKKDRAKPGTSVSSTTR
jgi:hypothetical protein